MTNDLLHRFFIEGGQVIYRAKNSGEVILPDIWFDNFPLEQWDKLKLGILEKIKLGETFPSLSVAETAILLNVSYRHTLELVRFQYLGTIKKSGVIQVYKPSIDAFFQKKELAPPWSKLWTY